jgi:hypothetical protein
MYLVLQYPYHNQALFSSLPDPSGTLTHLQKLYKEMTYFCKGFIYRKSISLNNNKQTNKCVLLETIKET